MGFAETNATFPFTWFIICDNRTQALCFSQGSVNIEIAVMRDNRDNKLMKTWLLQGAAVRVSEKLNLFQLNVVVFYVIPFPVVLTIISSRLCSKYTR